MRKHETKGWAPSPQGFSVNSNFICCFAMLGLTEGNFHKTLIIKPIIQLKHLIHIFIHQMGKEARNDLGMASPLQTSFSCT